MHGIGLRREHLNEIEENGPAGADWFEVETEQLFDPDTAFFATAERIRRDRPVTLHGVGLGIANLDPLDPGYLDRLAALVARFEPEWVSDHLSWSAYAGKSGVDLLPFPFDDRYLDHVAERVDAVQERLGQPLVLENISRYLDYRGSVCTEAEFLAALVERTGCRVLLDVNNLVVNAENLADDIEAALATIPAEAVVQYHLAGHTVLEDFVLDTHVGPVPDVVWRCYRRALQTIGPRPTIIEWDFELPSYEALLEESYRAREFERTSAPAAAFEAPDRARPEEDAEPAAFLHAMTNLDRVAPTHPLERYRRGFENMVLHTAWETYPMTLVRLGENEAHRTLARYLEANPPATANPTEVLAAFPEFLADPIVADLARFERALGEVARGRPDTTRALTLTRAVHRTLDPRSDVAAGWWRVLVRRGDEGLEVVEATSASQ